MPAPQMTPRPHDGRPALGHVNLMIDTFIANATVEDLRSISRNLLSTGPPGILPAFSVAARSRLCQTNAKALHPNPYYMFQRREGPPPSPTQILYDTLTRARSLYGAGMGFASLSLLASIVNGTVGLQWEENGDMADILAIIDADIGQAIQSCKEEIEAGRLSDYSSAREAVHNLRSAVSESMSDVKKWRGEFPFERAASTLEYWKI